MKTTNRHERRTQEVNSVVSFTASSSLALLLSFSWFYSCVDGKGTDSEVVLKTAMTSWSRQRNWDGPNAKTMKWRTAGSDRETIRVVDGKLYLSTFYRGGAEKPFIAFRNNEYAAWLEGSEAGWFLKDIAYRGEPTYDRYTREALAPWVMPHILPRVGVFSEAIESGQLKVTDVRRLDGSSETYRFVLQQTCEEDEKLMSSIEVDASPTTDWFPLRLYWVVRKSGKSHSYVASQLVLVDGFFVPQVVEVFSGSDDREPSKLFLVQGEARTLNPQECTLEFYGLGSIEVPKVVRQTSRWFWPLIACACAVVGSLIILRVRRVSKK